MVERKDMKHIVTVLLVASLCAIGMVAAATKINLTGQDEYGETMSHIILQKPDIFSGHILPTKTGLSIVTNEGTFLLRGVDLDEMIGRQVRVSGVLRDQHLFAVSVDVEAL